MRLFDWTILLLLLVSVFACGRNRLTGVERPVTGPRCLNGGVGDEACPVVTVAELAAPMNLSVGGDLILRWDHPEPDVAFEIEAGTSTTDSSFARVAVTLVNARSHAIAKPMVRTFYRVRAVSSDGRSPYSNVVHVDPELPYCPPVVASPTPPPPPVVVVTVAPATPTYVRVDYPSVSSTTAVLSWSYPATTNMFEIESSPAATSGFTKLYTAASGLRSLSFTRPSVTTYYRVRARASNGAYSAYSGVAYATPPPPPVVVVTPAAPTSAGIGDGSSNTVVLSWSYPSTSHTFEIASAQTADSAFTVIYTVASSSRSFSFARPSVTTYYRVRARASNGAVSPYSNAAYATPPPVIVVTPAAPTDVVIGYGTSNTVALFWNYSATTNVFEIQSSTSSTSGFTLLYTAAASLRHQVFPRPSVTTYYRVRARASSGAVSAYSNVAFATGSPPPPPPPPALSWNTPIYRLTKTLPGKNGTNIGLVDFKYSRSTSDSEGYKLPTDGTPDASLKLLASATGVCNIPIIVYRMTNPNLPGVVLHTITNQKGVTRNAWGDTLQEAATLGFTCPTRTDGNGNLRPLNIYKKNITLINGFFANGTATNGKQYRKTRLSADAVEQTRIVSPMSRGGLEFDLVNTFGYVQ